MGWENILKEIGEQAVLLRNVKCKCFSYNSLLYIRLLCQYLAARADDHVSPATN